MVYSTHILDDVQRVSDRVAILKEGRLVAQASVAELLAGEGSASYVVVLQAVPKTLQAELSALPWVTAVTARDGADTQSWVVSVSDTVKAKASLLRLVLQDPNVHVLEFRRKGAELEDVFFELMGGGERA